MATKAKARSLWEDQHINSQIIAYLDYYEQLSLQGLNHRAYNGDFFGEEDVCPIQIEQRDPLCLVWSMGPRFSNRVFYFDIRKQKYSWSSHKRMNFLRFLTVQVGRDLYRYRESIDGRFSYIRKYKDILSNKIKPEKKRQGLSQRIAPSLVNFNDEYIFVIAGQIDRNAKKSVEKFDV